MLKTFSTIEWAVRVLEGSEVASGTAAGERVNVGRRRAERNLDPAR